MEDLPDLAPLTLPPEPGLDDVAAHSGTVVGVIWPSQLAHDAIACRSAQLAQQFPELECLGISLMCSGGIEIL